MNAIYWNRFVSERKMCSELQLSLISAYRQECAILSLKLSNPLVYSALKGFSLSECIYFTGLDAFKNAGRKISPKC